MLDIHGRSKAPGIKTGINGQDERSVFDAVIVGAGIAGLATAFILHRQKKNVLVLEASGQVGGALRTHRREGFLVECGPNTVLDTHPEVAELVSAAGLSDRQIFASDQAKKRYVVRDGKLIPLPMSPGEFLKTPLFSPRAKLRLFGEPFIRKSDPDSEESVAAFTRRRLGREFLDYAIDPFVSGVYAGRPDRLSAKEAFPKLVEVEQRYGSLILGQIFGAKERRRRKETSKTTARMFSFADGLDSLPKAIARQIPERILTDSRVVSIRESGDDWVVSYVDDRGDRHAARTRTVVYASGLQDVKPLEAVGCDAALFQTIVYPPLSVVALGFRASEVQHSLDGFGLLAPSCEKRYVLGALFSSSLFDQRAPEDHVLITCFVGGARAPELAAAPENELIERTHRDLKILLGVTGSPAFTHVTRWPRAIPQYDIGYRAVKDHLREVENRNPGLLFAGNYLSGISVAESIKSGKLAAERASQYLQNLQERA